MKIKNIGSLIIPMLVLLTAYGTSKLPPFSSQYWHVVGQSGIAVSNRGMELGLGSEWMMHDNMLIQNAEQIVDYPELEKHLARGIAEFPEIIVDSVLFYCPSRKLLFAT